MPAPAGQRLAQLPLESSPLWGPSGAELPGGPAGTHMPPALRRGKPPPQLPCPLALPPTGHPLVLCTADSGILNTSLSREYAIAAHVRGPACFEPGSTGDGTSFNWGQRRPGVAHVEKAGLEVNQEAVP